MAVVNAVVNEVATQALPGLGRALVLAGKLPQQTAEEIFAKAKTSRTSFIAELMGSRGP